MINKRIPALLLALIMLLGSASCAKEEGGTATEGTAKPMDEAPVIEGAVMKTENFSVSAAEFSYHYMNIYLQMAYYSSYYGFSTEAPLDEQPMGEGEERTWHDFLINETKTSLTELLILCEKGRELGLSLDSEDEKIMEDTMTELASVAGEQNMSSDEFLNEYYGKAVTESVVRSCMEMQLLANKAEEAMKGSYEYTDTELSSYRDENKATFYYCDYRVLDIKADFSSGDSVDDITAAKEAAKAKAQSILDASHDERSFLAEAADYYRSTGVEEDDELSAKLDATLVKRYAYTLSGQRGQWLFAEDGDGAFLRREGDTTLISDDDNGKYSVYLMTTAPCYDDYRTRDVRHILIMLDSYDAADGLPDADAEAMAEEILSQWKQGEATEDSFGELAKEHSMDGDPSNGGLYEGVYKGQMVEPFESWLFAAEAEGETGIVKTNYGYHVMYYVGEGETEKWALDAVDAMRTADYTEEYSALKEKYPVTTEDGLAELIESA